MSDYYNPNSGKKSFGGSNSGSNNSDRFYVPSGGYKSFGANGSTGSPGSPNGGNSGKIIGISAGVVAVVAAAIGIAAFAPSRSATAEASPSYSSSVYSSSAASSASGEVYSSSNVVSLEDPFLYESTILTNPSSVEDKDVSSTNEDDYFYMSDDEEELPDDYYEYIIYDSNTRALTKSELDSYTASELFIARNEIYARHGRMFRDSGLQSHFNSCSWYHGTIAPENFDDNTMVSALEKQNAELILAYEREHGYM